MGTKSRETIYGASIRAAAERATEARKEADRLAVEAVEQAHAWLSSCIELIRESKMNNKRASDQKWGCNASITRKSVGKVARMAQWEHRLSFRQKKRVTRP